MRSTNGRPDDQTDGFGTAATRSAIVSASKKTTKGRKDLECVHGKVHEQEDI